jgi:cation diffusion facilitator family transporter
MSKATQNEYLLARRAALVSLVVGVSMLVMKTAAYALTHSAAILSDAMESVVHVVATSMAFYSVVVSHRPADDSHPFGHGKVEFFSAGVEGMLIVIAGVAIIFESVRGMIFGRELVALDVGLLITLAASVINLLLGLYLIRRGKATSSLTLVADGKHVLTDSYTSFAVVGGIGAVLLTGWEVLDPLVAIGVAFNIFLSGYHLVRVSIGGLMDESDQSTLERVVATIRKNRTPAWIALRSLRVMRSGRLHHVNFHLTIPFYWNVREAHVFEHEVSDTIASGLDNHAQVLVHLDPCKPSDCPSCAVHPCSERKQPLEKTPQWDIRTLVRGL